MPRKKHPGSATKGARRAAAQHPPATRTVFQLKIILLGAVPPIWRRIQTEDCTLDQLHRLIQAAMGWENCHLHQFRIGDQGYGNPALMEDSFDEFDLEDSTTATLRSLLSKRRMGFKFLYEYDFGDSWEHGLVFEGQVPAEAGRVFPICLEGERACPPEDVGGVWGYSRFLEAISNPEDEEHEEMREWVGGRFSPEKFDAAQATKAMRKALPD
jgi:hypothetical protein